MTDITGTNKERYDKTIRRREKLSGYYFDMSKLIFAATVLTNVDIFKGYYQAFNIFIIIVGIIATVLLATIGNKVMKY